MSAKKNPSVAVVILNWNGQQHLAKFLPSVLASTYPNLSIIVGDNASTDTSVAWLQKEYPQIQVIKNDKNYGFAGGYNHILARVDADYFVLLNSDVEVTPNWIEPVINLLESKPNAAAAQPKILSHTDKTSFEYAGAAGGFIDFLGYPFCRGRIFDTLEKDEGQYENAGEIFWASGAALFIKKEAWLQASGFDESLFAHMEEIDLCWRLKRLGRQIWYCPQASVYHVGGGTLAAESPQKTFLNFRNNLLMLYKNLPKYKGLAVIVLRFFLDFISLLKFLVDKKKANAWAISRAHVDFLKRIWKKEVKKAELSGNFNSVGLFPRSIVWQYFVRKQKTYTQL
ncbi:MAG: glycosyltransferase family 2 protein [Sphingobacteriaceae bacterium]